MSRNLQYFWPANNTQGVAALQTLAGAGALILNGTYSNAVNNTVNFIRNGFVRIVTLTSANNLSAVNFTIIGIQNGVSIIEVIAGPNNNTVNSTNEFDIITSITTSAAAAAVSSGTGPVGFFPLIGINAEKSLSNVSYALSFVTEAPAAGCTYSIYQSLTDLSNNGQIYIDLVVENLVIQKGNAYVSITQMLQITDVCKNILISVNSAAGGASTLQLQFLQL